MTAYVLVHNNFVINGPREWNYRSFESSLEEDCEIQFKLPMSKKDEEIIEIDENTKIYAAELVYPSYNPKIEYPHGPFWDFSTGKAIGTFQVLKTPVDLIKSALKEKVAEIRWRKEILGTQTTIQSIDVLLNTERVKRDVYAQKYLLMADDETVQWKFPQQWLTVTKQEMKQIVDCIDSHVQNVFAWEVNKIAAIDSCTTAKQLDAINLEE